MTTRPEIGFSGRPWFHLLLFCLFVSGCLLLLPTQSDAGLRQGGLNLSETQEGSGLAPRFGVRVLREGMSGPDVRVLNTIIGSRTASSIRFRIPDRFGAKTTRLVKRFQSGNRLRSTGVVNGRTADRLVGSIKTYGASWYGPGFFGGTTACGQKLRRSTVGVAHKTLPCGTRVLIGYRGRYLLTRVIDRGPFIAGRTWDLASGARNALGYSGIDRIRALIVR